VLDEIAPQTIKVVIVDDHEMVAEGIGAVLCAQDDIEVVGIAGTVADSVDLVERLMPDVVIMDFQLPDGDGGDATRAILQRTPSVAVLMLTGSGEGNALAKAIESGCAGFLLKGLGVRDLDSAVRAVSRGEIVIHGGLLREALPSLRGPRAAPEHDLTPKELEILALLAGGATTDGLASELFVSRHTVRNHVARILAKLGAHSRLEAVALATREGIIKAAA
jgi:DNA-binding NarL/FixJ family response regulator